MTFFKIPNREDLAPHNQEIYDSVKGQLGQCPNLYTYMGKHNNALGDYLSFINRKSTLSADQKEIVSLVVSQYNGCQYCQSAHTVLGKMSGLSDESMLAIRRSDVTGDQKTDALVGLVADLMQSKGAASKVTLSAFFEAGFTEQNFIDVVFCIADKTITNFIARTADIAIDFPLAPSI